MTDADLVLAAMLSVYVLVESVSLFVETIIPISPRPVSGVSVYTALLLMLTLRMHNTFDNPYLPTLTVMFGTRTFYEAPQLPNC